MLPDETAENRGQMDWHQLHGGWLFDEEDAPKSDAQTNGRRPLVSDSHAWEPATEAEKAEATGAKKRARPLITARPIK